MGTLSVRLRLLVLLVLLAGCSSNEVDPPAPDGPTSLQPAASSSPRGTERVTCDLEADSGPVRLGLDLPIAFRSGRAGPRGCTWRTRVEMHDSDYPYTIDVVVTARPASGTLQEVYDDEEPFLVTEDDPGGDDAILDLALDQGVAALGPTIGDRISWRCFCDGQDLITRMAQADGIRVTWSSVVPLTKQTDAAFARAVAGAGTV